MTPEKSLSAQAQSPAPAKKPAEAAPKPKRKLELNAKNIRLLMAAGLALLFILFFVITFYGLSVLSGKSQSMVSLKAQSQADDSVLSNLESSKKQVEKYSYFKDIAKTVIPSDKDQAAAILEIGQIANDAGINIQSITFPTSSLGAGGLSTATPAAGTTPAAAAASSSALTQAIPVPGIPGLYSLALTITPDTSSNLPPNLQVTYAKMLDFLNRIENNRHTAQITQVSIQTGANSANAVALSFNLTVNIFIKP